MKMKSLKVSESVHAEIMKLTSGAVIAGTECKSVDTVLEQLFKLYNSDFSAAESTDFKCVNSNDDNFAAICQAIILHNKKNDIGRAIGITQAALFYVTGQNKIQIREFLERNEKYILSCFEFENSGTKENGYVPEKSIFGKKSDSGRTTAGFLELINNKNFNKKTGIDIGTAIAEAVKNEGFEKFVTLKK